MAMIQSSSPFALLELTERSGPPMKSKASAVVGLMNKNKQCFSTAQSAVAVFPLRKQTAGATSPRQRQLSGVPPASSSRAVRS